jgi:hypothetical protein
MHSIHIKCIILFDDGTKYYYSEDPGIVVSEFSAARGTTEDDERNNYKNYSFRQFDFNYDDGSTFDDLVKTLFKEIGFIYELAFIYGPLPLNIYVNGLLIYVENMNYNFELFINKNNVKSDLEIFLIYNSQAGSIWREDGIEYFMYSKEAGKHQRAHVHIDYKHDYDASIAIDDGEVLDGKIPSKILRVVRDRIEENKEFLYNCWNSMTDGLPVDINHYLGKRKIENTEGIKWW